MSMESANKALATTDLPYSTLPDTGVPETPEQRQMKSIFGQTAAGHEPAVANNDAQETRGQEIQVHESPTMIPLREREKTERFARDINAKIDALEDQLGRSTTLLEHSQETAKTAIDALREDIAEVRNTAEEKLAVTRTDLQEQRYALADQQATLAQQRDELHAQQQTLESHRAGIDSHRQSLDKLQQNVAAHSHAIAAQGETLEQQQAFLSSHAGHIETLDQHQTMLHQSLTALSQEHDAMAGKVDQIADQLYDNGVQIATQRNQTQLQFRRLSTALVATSAAMLAVFGYFLFNPIAAPDAVESRLTALGSDMERQAGETTNLSGELQRIGNNLSVVESNVAQLQSNQSQLLSGQAGSHEDIGKLRNQLSQVEKSVSNLRASLQRASTGSRTAATGSRSTSTRAALPVRDSAWLASRPRSHYVIQLAGAHDKDSLRRYVNAHAGSLKQHPLAIMSGSRQGQGWHHLMYGDFASQQQARKALASLPAALQSTKPWVRQLASVQ